MSANIPSDERETINEINRLLKLYMAKRGVTEQRYKDSNPPQTQFTKNPLFLVVYKNGELVFYENSHLLKQLHCVDMNHFFSKLRVQDTTSEQPFPLPGTGTSIERIRVKLNALKEALTEAVKPAPEDLTPAQKASRKLKNT